MENPEALLDWKIIFKDESGNVLDTKRFKGYTERRISVMARELSDTVPHCTDWVILKD